MFVLFEMKYFVSIKKILIKLKRCLPDSINILKNNVLKLANSIMITICNMEQHPGITGVLIIGEPNGMPVNLLKHQKTSSFLILHEIILSLSFKRYLNCLMRM